MDRKTFLKRSLSGIGAFGALSFMNILEASQAGSNSQKILKFKIRDVETYLHPSALWVKVITEEGVSGWGEADHDNKEVIATIIHKLAKPILLGNDPFESEYLWHQIFYKGEDLGLSGALTGALAGIDNALWDLKGKLLDMPVYKLLGGNRVEKIKVYGSYGIGEGNKRKPPEECAKIAADFVSKGYDTVKLRMQLRVLGRNPEPELTLDYTKKVREAIGDDITLFVDFNNGYTSGKALGLIMKLYEFYNVQLVEEPVHYRDYVGLKKITALSPIRIAAGEHDFNRIDFRELILQGNPDVLNLDIIKGGGISEMKKVASLALAFEKEVMCHNARPTLASAATLQLVASIFNPARIQEFGGRREELGQGEFFQNELKFDQGYLFIPQNPGLGLIPDEKQMAKIRYKL